MFTENHFKTLFCINVNSCIDYIYDSQVNLHFYGYCRKNILQNTKKFNQIFKIFLIDTIDETTNLYNDLGMDSLGIFSLGMYLIKEYSIQISVASVARIETVHDIFTIMNEEGVFKD